MFLLPIYMSKCKNQRILQLINVSINKIFLEPVSRVYWTVIKCFYWLDVPRSRQWEKIEQPTNAIAA